MHLVNMVWWLKNAHKILTIYRLQKLENGWISVYELKEGWSWVTLTQLNHVYTHLNMIVHLVGRVLIYTLQHCIQCFPVKRFFNYKWRGRFTRSPKGDISDRAGIRGAWGGVKGSIGSPQIPSTLTASVYPPPPDPTILKYIVHFSVIIPYLLSAFSSHQLLMTGKVC